MGDETRQRKSGVVLQELAVKPEFRDIHVAEAGGSNGDQRPCIPAR